MYGECTSGHLYLVYLCLDYLATLASWRVTGVVAAGPGPSPAKQLLNRQTHCPAGTLIAAAKECANAAAYLGLNYNQATGQMHFQDGCSADCNVVYFNTIVRAGGGNLGHHNGIYRSVAGVMAMGWGRVQAERAWIHCC